ncbi:hypothetical protein ACOME3_010524 [Neoechinorhynchus agilis]
MDTFNALTTKEARMNIIIRTLLKRAQSAITSKMPTAIESVVGPELATPVTGQIKEKSPSTTPASRSILGKERCRLSSSEEQGEFSRTVYTIDASCKNLLDTNNPTKARAKFRDDAIKILDDRKAHFIGLMTANETEVAKARELLKKRPRDTVLNQALEDLRVAQNGIDDSLAIIDGVMEEIKATANLDDLPFMNVYRNDLDLESLVNCPVDLGTAFMAYVSRARATMGQTETGLSLRFSFPLSKSLCSLLQRTRIVGWPGRATGEGRVARIQKASSSFFSTE